MEAIVCPNCSNDDPKLIEQKDRKENSTTYLCIVCSKDWIVGSSTPKIPSGRKVA
jgi:hypothetical protein